MTGIVRRSIFREIRTLSGGKVSEWRRKVYEGRFGLRPPSLPLSSQLSRKAPVSRLWVYYPRVYVRVYVQVVYMGMCFP